MDRDATLFDTAAWIAGEAFAHADLVGSPG
jgi:hypothetical protein